MTFARKCPQCGEPLTGRAKACVCGWLRHSPPPQEPSTTRCAYPGCPARGTLYDAPYGGGQAWCRWHYGDRGASGAQIAEGLVREGVPHYGNWREELEERLQSKIGQHPERQKQSRESSKHYAQRMLQIFRETSATMLEDKREAGLEREAIQAEGA